MTAATDVECELAGLMGYVQTGLLPPGLQRRLRHLPPMELRIALRDVLDWLSLRSILRGRTTSLGGRVHPLVGRILPQLMLGQWLCFPDSRLAYRVDVPLRQREELEDTVRHRVWDKPRRHRAASGTHPAFFAERRAAPHLAAS